MAAFGASQGGKDSAKESAPKKGHSSGNTDAPGGGLKLGQVHKGVGGSRKGFGA